mgnify:CR=1 FL=1
MFKFEKYPKILEAHKIEMKNEKKMYVASRKYENSNYDNELKASFDKIFAEMEDFSYNVYAKVIFEEFNQIKPLLRYVWEKDKYVKWEELIGDDFEKCTENQRKTLVNMIEQDRPYQLPDEYYTEPVYKEL